MSGNNNYQLPNNNDDEGRGIDGTNHNNEGWKRHRVEEPETEVEQQHIEERLKHVQRRYDTQQTNVLQGDELNRWLAEATSVVEELQRLILRNEYQPQSQQQQPSDGATNDETGTHIANRNRSPSPMEICKSRLDFFEFCIRLKFNHLNVNTVKISSSDTNANDAFPDGRLRCLGNAMLYNTKITELIVDVDIMIQEMNDIQRAAAFIEFVRTSTSLQKVGVHAYSEFRATTDGRNIANQFAGLILDAIRTNTFIQELYIWGSYPIDAFCRLMSTSSSLKSLRIHCRNFNVIVNHDHRNQLLRSLAKNRSIEHLSFTFYEDYGWAWLEGIPRYMASGPAKVRTLMLEHCRELPPSFYELMRTTSLQTLKLCFELEEFSLENQSRLNIALARNESIENLHLMVHSNVDHILHHLHNGPSSLRKLSLKYLKYDFDALQQYLCRTSQMLQHLELEGSIMDERLMNCLVVGLRALDSRQSSVTTRLELKSCQLQDGAMDKLVEFIAARNNYHNNQQHAGDFRSLLLEDPNLNAAIQSPPEIIVGYSSRFGDHVSVSMSTTLLSSAISSYHSGSTHCISMSTRPNGNALAYCDSLVAVAEVSSVVCFQLSHLRSVDIIKLFRALPRLQSLSALHLINIQDDVEPTSILKELQQNGTLFVTSFRIEEQRPFFQRTRDRIIVQSYCQRNRFLSEMIFGKMAFYNVCSVDVVTLVSNDDANGNRLGDSRCTNNNNQLVLLPKLFRVSIRIPLIRSRFLLAALLELNMTIGPRNEHTNRTRLCSPVVVVSNNLG